jgi:hypothetical protein
LKPKKGKHAIRELHLHHVYFAERPWGTVVTNMLFPIEVNDDKNDAE